MADIAGTPTNFGILQAQPGPQTQVMQRPNYGLMNAQAAVSGMSAGVDAGTKMQEMSIEKQKLPGILQGQQLQNQGQALQNQTTQMNNSAAQYQLQMRQDRIKAYEDGKAKGGTEAGLDKVQDTYLDQGDTDSYTKLKDAREKTQQAISDDDKTNIKATASALVGAVKNAQPAQTDPKTGQVVQPAVTSLDNYTKIYPTLKQLNPRAPDPSSFKSDEQFQDTYIHPVLDTSRDSIAQDKAKQDALDNNALYQANQMVDTAKDKVKTATEQHGVNSPEAKQAADEYTTAINDRNTKSTANNYVTGTANSLGQAWRSWKNGGQVNTPQQINSGNTYSSSSLGSANGSIAAQQPTPFFNPAAQQQVQPQVQQYQVPNQQGQQPGQQTPIQVKQPQQPQAPIGMPKFQSAQDANSWFKTQSPAVQADIKANPQKYGIDPR